MEQTEFDGSDAQQARIQALDELLEQREVDLAELLAAISLGEDVAPTPSRSPAPLPEANQPRGAAQPHEPSLAPAVGARTQSPPVPTAPLMRTNPDGSRTVLHPEWPTMENPDYPSVVRTLTEFDQRLRQTEAENAALKLAAGRQAASGDLTPNMAEVMNNQNKLLEAIVNQPKREPSSTIKV